MENVATRKKLTVKKQSNLITQDELRNVGRDEVNEVGNYIYITESSLYYINDAVYTWLGKSQTARA